ncbi:SDR family NAD(P)-dependent oxidoreductase [Alkalicoccobacillus gibsonii]|uniref:SDR family NAD(P)-dependent oxidoreductase n=1 Tax=Alkalicoccobacillus gibsonii TaxID=79881 RepID=UPI003514C43B
MDLQLKGKVVFVTGGSKGIGRAIAKAFLEEGATVAVAARGEKELLQCERELNIHTVQADLSIESERERAFKNVTEALGTVDILINNVGGSNGSTIEETEMNTFQEAFDLNYFSAVHFSKLAFQQMKQKQGGVIVNISSVFGRESGGKPTYNGAKAALISFTKAFADEAIQYGVRVNGVAPGSILHPSGNWQKRVDENPEKMKAFVEAEIPAGRFGTAEEIAHTVVFLASQKASWVVGATLNVDGGQSKSNF